MTFKYGSYLISEVEGLIDALESALAGESAALEEERARWEARLKRLRNKRKQAWDERLTIVIDDDIHIMSGEGEVTPTGKSIPTGGGTRNCEPVKP